MKDHNTIMGNFRAGLTCVLITTDVVGHTTQGRDVSLVVDYDMPTNPERPTSAGSPQQAPARAYTHAHTLTHHYTHALCTHTRNTQSNHNTLPLVINLAWIIQ
eukprot:TRINITY_DN1654_c0_g1_i10.p2 TRINITY_DN1654_c0_g1~~TRINITY_DN1654_c0_g1_i10.p2  ORF type:complete len:103 (+),score=21.79 TRINITY_DN1654_c0_g1_i10:383-691(+)